MLALVRMAVETELRKRKKLEDVNTVEDVVNLIKKSSNIVILAGAGSPPSLSLAPIFPLQVFMWTVLIFRDKYILWDSGL
jgi:hypothetical protein